LTDKFEEIKMKSFLRIIFSLIGAGILISLMACTDILVSNFEKESHSSVDIADFEVPNGFHADYITTMMGYSVMAYSRGDTPSHLYLIQSEKETDADVFIRTIDELIDASGNQQSDITVIERIPIQIRDQETILIISDCHDAEGLPYRQAAVAFQGNGGPSLLVYSVPIENWDMVAVYTLLESIQ
jgi:hypothetical protein